MKIALALLGLFAAVALTLTGVALYGSLPPGALTGVDAFDPFDVLFPLALVSYLAVGMLIVWRRTRNAVGWIFCAIGALSALVAFAEGYSRWGALGRVGSVPGTELFAWLSTTLAEVPLALLVILLLVFPDGRLMSRRWWPLLWLGVAVNAAVVASLAFSPGPLANLTAVENPLGIEDAAGALGLLASIAGSASPLVSLACAAALLLRLRRAHGRERQQLKWFVYCTALGLIVFIASEAVASLLGVADTRAADNVTSLAALVPTVAIPAAAGFAILRHRLYDIDVAVNRTLVYGALTACLALAYWGSVVLLGQLLQPLAPGYDLAIAGSTLAVAALFRPLRGRIQAAVDHRFYRRRYDATQTLEGFSARLREQLDLDAVGGELSGVVAETMQPAHMSLWLRTPGQSARRML